jgi:hypothetical protein
MIKIMMAANTYKALKECSSKDKTRLVIGGYHITDKYIETTDGKMLLRVNRELVSIPDGTKAGAYNEIGTGKVTKGFVEIALEEMDVEYPDTKQVIPETSPVSEQISVPIATVKEDELSLSSAMIKVYRHTGNAYAFHFFERLAVLNETWLINKAEQDKAIKATACNEYYVAVILPFKM